MKYQKGFKYQVFADESIFVDWLVGYNIDLPFISVKDGWVTAKKGYAWDGASKPAINTKSFRRGSLFHDILYQLMRLELIPRAFRHKADKLLVKLCLEDKMWKLRTKWVMWGVDHFAALAAHPDHMKRVYTAP